jgi:hypothetical protein
VITLLHHHHSIDLGAFSIAVLFSLAAFAYLSFFAFSDSSSEFCLQQL